MNELNTAAETTIGALKLGLSQTTLTMLWIGIAIYMAGMLSIGFWCGRKIHGMGDFLVANRRLPLWMATATLLATWFGAGSSMGVAATVYTDGIGGVIADPFAAAISLIIAGIFVVGMLRRANCMTVTDIVMRRYGKWAGIYTSFWMIPVYIGWLGAQVMGMGTILQILTGVDYVYGTLIAAAVVLTYTTLGGMWAVTLTDVVQVTLIIAGLILIIPGAMTETGGWDAMLANVPKEQLSIGPGAGTKSMSDWVYYIGSWIVMGLGCVVGQDVIQRALSSRTDKIAISSSVMAGFFYIAVGMIPIIIGFCARIVFAKYNIHLTGDLENQVLPNMAILILGKYTPIVLILFLSALISAIMSSADSSLLAGSSLLVNNVISPVFPNLPDRKLLVITRFSTVLLTIIATLLALKVDSIYRLMINSWASQLVIIFIPVIAALYVKRASANCAWACMMTATVFWIGYMFFDTFGLKFSIGELAEGGMTAKEFMAAGFDSAKYFTSPVQDVSTELTALAKNGIFNLDAAKDLSLAAEQTPFRLIMNSTPFERTLTCGAVYGFFAGALAFLFTWLGETICRVNSGTNRGEDGISD